MTVSSDESEPGNVSDSRDELTALANLLNGNEFVADATVVPTGRGPAVSVLLIPALHSWRGEPAELVVEEGFGVEDVSRQAGQVVGRVVR